MVFNPDSEPATERVHVINSKFEGHSDHIGKLGYLTEETEPYPEFAEVIAKEGYKVFTNIVDPNDSFYVKPDEVDQLVS